MRNLESFSLGSTKSTIHSSEYEQLFSTACSLSNMKNICLILNNYCRQEGEFLKIFKHFEQLKCIENFRFQINDNSNNDLVSIFYNEQQKTIKTYIKDIKLDENLIQSLPLVIKNMSNLEAFNFNCEDSNASMKELRQLSISLGSITNLQKLDFEINKNNFAQEEYFSLFNYLGQSKSLNNLIFQFNHIDCDKNQASIVYDQQKNKIVLDLSGFQINKNDIQSLSSFIKSLDDLQIIEVNFNTCKISSNKLISLFSFFRDHKSINHLSFGYYKQKITSEQLYALVQPLKQSKSLKKLEIQLSKTMLEKQANEILSQQLSQLESIQSLKYRVLQDDIDISSSFIDEIVKNTHLQDLDITFFHLEQLFYQINTQKLLGMPNLKNLTLQFYIRNNYARETQFFENMDNIKQTNLQKLTIALHSFYDRDQKVDFYEQLGKFLSSQRVIQNLEIQIMSNISIESCTSLIKELKNTYLKTFQFIFKDWNYFLYKEELEKLKIYSLRKLQRAVKLEFQ
ncbi:hypothetical protein ABPG73_006382 [Tetrahymena malaccensis]